MTSGYTTRIKADANASKCYASVSAPMRGTYAPATPHEHTADTYPLHRALLGFPALNGLALLVTLGDASGTCL